MLECGMVWDMVTESGNDGEKYPLKAGPEQFREFIGGGEIAWQTESKE